MPFFNWALLKSRTLHPDIGIPADDTQGLPYLQSFQVSPYQNYGLQVKTQSGTDSITGYLFTANKRYLLGSGEVKAINYSNALPMFMFAIDSFHGHVFATTASGIINNPISISGNSLGWSGEQSTDIVLNQCSPPITFFHYSGSNFVGFGNGENYIFSIFTPGGVENAYSGFSPYVNGLQPCSFYNGLYTILYGPSQGSAYGFLTEADAPTILPAYPSINIFSYSFTESAVIFSFDGDAAYGYDGVGDPTLAASFIKTSYEFNVDNGNDIFAFDPGTGRLLSISPNFISVGGREYFPVYVYNSILSTPAPQQYARPVKNFTVNGHLNWRKQR